MPNEEVLILASDVTQQADGTWLAEGEFGVGVIEQSRDEAIRRLNEVVSRHVRDLDSHELGHFLERLPHGVQRQDGSIEVTNEQGPMESRFTPTYERINVERLGPSSWRASIEEHGQIEAFAETDVDARRKLASIFAERVAAMSEDERILLARNAAKRREQS